MHAGSLASARHWAGRSAVLMPLRNRRMPRLSSSGRVSSDRPSRFTHAQRRAADWRHKRIGVCCESPGLAQTKS